MAKELRTILEALVIAQKSFDFSGPVPDDSEVRALVLVLVMVMVVLVPLLLPPPPLLPLPALLLLLLLRCVRCAAACVLLPLSLLLAVDAVD